MRKNMHQAFTHKQNVELLDLADKMLNFKDLPGLYSVRTLRKGMLASYKNRS